MVRNPPVNAGDVGLIPGMGRFPGEENEIHSNVACLGNLWTEGSW